LFTAEEIAVMEIIILVGLQASGKSTFYRTHFVATHEYVSKDLLNSSKNKNKNQKQAELIERAFQEQRSVVVDNTNVTVQDRLPLIDVGHRYGATIIGYYFLPDVSSSRTRNIQRIGKAQVPDVAIFVTANKFTPPSYAEGFDTLYYVRIPPEDARPPSSSSAPRFIVTLIPRDGL
jgi:predicted kinase